MNKNKFLKNPEKYLIYKINYSDQLGGAEDTPVEKSPAKQQPVNQPPAEQPPVEQLSTNQPPAEQPPAKQPTAEQPTVDQPPVDKPPAEQPPTEQSPKKQPTAEQPPAEQETIIPTSWSIGKPPGDVLDWGSLSNIALKKQMTLPIINKCFELSNGSLSTSSKIGIFNNDELKITKITKEEMEVDDVKNNKKYLLKLENACFNFINEDIDFKFKQLHVNNLDKDSQYNYNEHWRSSLFAALT